MSLVLAIDQGGHATRAVIYDASGQVRGAALRRVGTSRPRPGWVEQDAEELVASVRDVVGRSLSLLDPAEPVAAAGLAVQRSSVVCWDRMTGAPLSPVISWQDRRGADVVAGLADASTMVRDRTGLPLSPHYGATKLRWCLDTLPAVSRAFGDGRLACGPLSSFLVSRLAAESPLLAEPAGAGRTQLFNPEHLDWDQELLGLFDVPREVLPACAATHHAFGTLKDARRDIPLTVVAGDQSVVPFAWGAPDPGAAYVNLGTGAFVQRIFSVRPAAPAALLVAVARSGEHGVDWAVEGTVNGGASAVDRVTTELGLDARPDLEEALRVAKTPPLFLNGVSGLGSPFWVAAFPSRFVGEGSAPEKLAAVGESIVFLLMVNLQLLAGPGPALTRVVATGGLSRLDGLCRRLADLSRLPVHRHPEHEATARGVARLAGGAGAARDGDGWTCFEPGSDGGLDDRFARWREVMDSAIRQQGSGE